MLRLLYSPPFGLTWVSGDLNSTQLNSTSVDYPSIYITIYIRLSTLFFSGSRAQSVLFMFFYFAFFLSFFLFLFNVFFVVWPYNLIYLSIYQSNLDNYNFPSSSSSSYDYRWWLLSIWTLFLYFIRVWTILHPFCTIIRFIFDRRPKMEPIGRCSTISKRKNLLNHSFYHFQIYINFFITIFYWARDIFVCCAFPRFPLLIALNLDIWH